MTEIKKRSLGKTGLEVTELGLGCGPLGRDNADDPEYPVQLVHRALKLGISFLDTAPLYAGGKSQEILGEALAKYDTPYVLSTKCGRWPWQDGPYRSLDSFKRQLENSLESLKRDSVDLLFVHEADWAVYWEEMTIPRQRCEITLSDMFDYEEAPVTKFLVWAQEQGLADHIGFSGNNAPFTQQNTERNPAPSGSGAGCVSVQLDLAQYQIGVDAHCQRDECRADTWRSTATGHTGRAPYRMVADAAGMDG